ncbi:MAG: hypothetical protein ACJAYY_000302 [Paraglaciecola sp.]
MGTGPSIKTQNLLPLKDEIVFSLSRFYYHPIYKIIKPKYQVISGYVHHNLVEEDGKAYDMAKEVEESSIAKEIFNNYSDKEFFEVNRLFCKKKQTISMQIKI